jgi:hypothetical protein
MTSMFVPAIVSAGADAVNARLLMSKSAPRVVVPLETAGVVVANETFVWNPGTAPVSLPDDADVFQLLPAVVQVEFDDPAQNAAIGPAVPAATVTFSVVPLTERANVWPNAFVDASENPAAGNVVPLRRSVYVPALIGAPTPPI